MNKAIFLMAALSAAVLAGCSTQQRVSVDAAAASAKIVEQQQILRQSIIDADKQRIAQQDVNRPYIAGNSQPLAREVAMPEQLRRPIPVTALFQKGAVDLGTALRQISEASGALVTATPDALLPPSSFAARTAVQSSPVQAPSQVVLPSQSTPLWTLLDDVARQAGVAWRTVPGGAEFYRVETRVFQLAAIPQMATTSASLGRNAGSNAVFESQSKSSFETKDQNLLNGIKATVEAMLTVGGRATISQENQTLVVTDTPASLAKVATYVEQQNKAMSRRVRVLIEAIEVVAKDGNEVGIDWNLIYSTANRAIAVTPLANLAGSQAGALSLQRTTGPYAGSSLVLKALSEVGTIVNRRSFPFITTSGRPVTQALRSTFNYVDQVQATAVASSVTVQAQAPTVTQKDETVGTFVTLVPTAKADGTIFLSISFDVTSAQPLTPFTVGSGASAVTVQQKTIDGTGVIQEVPVRSGQTVVVGGIETQSSQSTERRLANGAPILLGGSDSAKVTKTHMVLLVTAVAEEGI